MAPRTEPQAQAIHPYPLYSTTYTIHRLSPLHTGENPLTASTLQTYASSLRDLLVGNILRGVRVGLSENDQGFSRAGTLQQISWTHLNPEDEYSPSASQDDSTPSSCLHLQISYERSTFTALFMRSRYGTGTMEGFEAYPLLLTRMPIHLQQTTIQFLHATFDCLATPAKLPGEFLTSSLETYLFDLAPDVRTPQSISHFQNTIKDVLLTLSFAAILPSTTLKTIDITIPRRDILPFVKAGSRLDAQMPFYSALKQYVKAHLALNMNDKHIQISKIACGGFVLGEGRIKMFPPSVGEGGEEWDDIRRTSCMTLVEGLMSFVSGKADGKVASPIL